MRAAGLARIGGGPEPGSSGWSGGRSGLIGSCAAARRRGAACGGSGCRCCGGGGGGGGGAGATACGGGICNGGAGGRCCGGSGAVLTARTASLPAGNHRAARLAAHAVLDRGQAVDHQRERAVHAVERILRARDVVLELVDRRRTVGAQAGALLAGLDMHQQVAQAALDRLQLADARFGGIELFHQLDDAVLEMTHRDLSPREDCSSSILSDSDCTSASSCGGTAPPDLHALGDRVGQRVDALLEMVERRAAGGGMRDLFDALGQRLHLGRQTGRPSRRRQRELQSNAAW